MDGLLVLSPSGDLILRSSFDAPATYPLAIVDALIHLLKTSPHPLPPIIYLPSLSPLAFKPFKLSSPDHLDDDEDESSSGSENSASAAPHRAPSPIDHQPPFSSHQPWSSTPSMVPSQPQPQDLDHQDSPAQADNDQLARSRTQHQAQLGSICCNLFKHNLWLSCVASSDMEPSIIFDFLNRFIELVASKYVDRPLGPAPIEANFELVHMLLSLTAPTRSSPFGKNWAETGLVEELVPNPRRSLVKMLSQAAETLSKGKRALGPKPSIFSSNIPWRPTGIEYAKQEILLDFTEKVSAILDRDGKPIKQMILGVVDVQCRLSGMPDLVMKFTDPGHILEAGFHGCVRQGRWATKRVVSFVPPDGRFRLMSYTAQLPRGVPLPVVVRPTVTHGLLGGSFALQVAPHAPLVRVAISWHLGPAATGIVAEQLSCRRRDGGRVDVRWEWDETRKVVSWTIEGEDADCCLTGLWTHSDENNRVSSSIEIGFEGKPASPSLSNLKVEQLENCEDYNCQVGIGNGVVPVAGGKDRVSGVGRGGGGKIRKGVKMKIEDGKYEVRL